MGVEFTVFKGSSSGEIVQSTGHREPKSTEVLVKISHSGVCGTDEHHKHVDQGLGHEGVGVITELGSEVQNLSDFRVGDRVGMSYNQKYCGRCKACLSGRQTSCANMEWYGAANLDQGTFGTAVAWDISALFKIPDDLPSEYAAPLMCGGASVWAPLYEAGVRAGDRIGIIGIGGLGHMAIQFASKMGFEAVVFSTTEAKREQAIAFGAAEFYDTTNVDKLAAVEKLDMLLITASSAPNLATFAPLLNRGAKIVPLTVSFEPLSLSPLDLIMGNFSVLGIGTAQIASIQAMLNFAAKHNVRPQIEKFPLNKGGITDAMQKLRDGKMRYRGVLVV